MERFSQKDRVFTTPFSPPKEPDIDFNDVFGGPPKRSSSHESRYSFTESTRRNSRSLEDDDEAFLQRNPWSGVREKPVFGEEMVNRRKYPSEDFYEDIFRGDEVAVGSPRRASQEGFGSGLGGLSPSRPFPPVADPYGSSLPAQIQFSLPAKLTKGTDPSTNSSINRKYKEPISSTKGFLYTPSPLSQEASLIKEAPFINQPEETKSSELKSQLKSPSKNTEKGNQFHFSIYKWASKGVPVWMLQRGIKSGKLRDAIKSEILSTFEKSEILSGNNKVHCAEEIKQDISLSQVSRGDKKVEIKAAFWDSQEAEVKSLRSFLGTSEEEVADKVKTNKKSEQKDNAKKKANVSDTNEDIRKKVQKHDEEKYKPKKEVIEIKEPQSVDFKRGSKETFGRNKSKGKVKEFVKIFNQEVDSKTKNDTETRNSSSEMGSASFEKADIESSAKTPQTYAYVMLDKKFEEPKKKHSHLRTYVDDSKEKANDRNDEKASNLESHLENAQSIDEDIDDIGANFTVQELSTDQQAQNEENYEDIQSSDARIRKWSRGKEGNIRSLLSTLQYVLWPGSGWKPVPLVDIIEGNAVKRSYQRAMLCLHPDKLQQKGAADYQKYIAQKVFDILQEAWDQFNSLGLV